jgi:hypothetical protein
MMRIRGFRYVVITVLVALVAAACGVDDTDTAAQAFERGGLFPDLYDPTSAGEPLPDDYRTSLPRDAINPVYEPVFVKPGEVDWPLDELVIGVDLDGEQRAYPVGYLSFREIVIDSHRGIPTMVTW